MNAQNINNFYGVNAWAPQYVGTSDIGGELDNLWGSVADSKPVYIRIGGIGFDLLNPDAATGYRQNLQNMIADIRAVMPNAKIIVQIPVKNVLASTATNTVEYTPIQAANLVTYLNSSLNLNITDFAIGNEPSSEYKKAGADYTAEDIVDYFLSFSEAMRDAQVAINSNPLVIWGPDLNENDYSYGNQVMSDLLGNGVSPATQDIRTKKDGQNRYILDVLTYHTYPYGHTYSRNDLITFPNSGFKSQLQLVVNDVDAGNLSRASTPLKVAVTELNVNFAANFNPDGTPQPLVNPNVSSGSFLAGQYWADMFANGLSLGLATMIPWSVHESGGDGDNDDKGYLGGPTGSIKRSTFFHYKMMANYFNKGQFYPSTSINQADVKAFACKTSNY
jgi:hypothetical protein